MKEANEDLLYGTHQLRKLSVQKLKNQLSIIMYLKVSKFQAYLELRFHGETSCGIQALILLLNLVGVSILNGRLFQLRTLHYQHGKN